MINVLKQSYYMYRHFMDSEPNKSHPHKIQGPLLFDLFYDDEFEVTYLALTVACSHELRSRM